MRAALMDYARNLQVYHPLAAALVHRWGGPKMCGWPPWVNQRLFWVFLSLYCSFCWFFCVFFHHFQKNEGVLLLLRRLTKNILIYVPFQSLVELFNHPEGDWPSATDCFQGNDWSCRGCCTVNSWQHKFKHEPIWRELGAFFRFRMIWGKKCELFCHKVYKETKVSHDVLIQESSRPCGYLAMFQPGFVGVIKCELFLGESNNARLW